MRAWALRLFTLGAIAFSSGPSNAGGMMGDSGPGIFPGGGGFTTLQRGFGGPSMPFRQGGQPGFVDRGRGFIPRHPDHPRHGGRNRPYPYGYGIGLVYPYVDDGAEDVYEEEPPLYPATEPPPQQTPRPKPSSGPKTVSAPSASSNGASSSAADGSLNCDKGRKVSLSAARSGVVGCISP